MDSKFPPSFAFQTSFQSFAYFFVILLFLFLPTINYLVGTEAIEERYHGISDDYYTFVHHEIFEETKDIDILFIGFCYVRMGVQASYVQKEFFRTTGKAAIVLALGTYHPAQDLVWLMLKDLLQRRKIKMVVIHFPSNRGMQDTPHTQAPQWIKFGDLRELGEGQPFVQKMRLYSSAILGAPLNILRQFRREYPVPSNLTIEKLGNVDVKFCDSHSPFEEIDIKTKNNKPSEWIYSKKTKAKFTIIDKPYPKYQEILIENTIRLLKKYNVLIVQLHIPNLEERNATTVQEHYDWASRFDYPIKVVGIPPLTFFQQVDERARKCLFWDEDHFNPNGSKYFSRLITPSLLDIYRTGYGI